MEWVTFLVGFVVGLTVGAMWLDIRRLRKTISELSTSQPEKKVRVINPSYEPRKQGVGSAHVVMPKSPGQIEYEAEQRAMKKTLVERSLERK
jgi:hypothetical protein